VQVECRFVARVFIAIEPMQPTRCFLLIADTLAASSAVAFGEIGDLSLVIRSGTTYGPFLSEELRRPRAPYMQLQSKKTLKVLIDFRVNITYHPSC
jgi:hypothetical protein